MSARELFSFRNHVLQRQRRHHRGRFPPDRARRLHRAALRSARTQVRRTSGMRSAAPPACRGGPPSSRRPNRAPPVRGRPDADHAGASEPGIHRPRRDARATLRDLPWPDRHQPRELAQSRGPICRRDLQGACWISARARAPTRSCRHSRSTCRTRTSPISPPTMPTCRACRPTIPTPQLPSPRIVIYGAPMRGIAPCGACHGSLDNKTGSPWLEGQSEVYLKAQLQAFASGQRHQRHQSADAQHRPRHDAAGDRRGRRLLCLAAAGDCEGDRLSGVGTGASQSRCDRTRAWSAWRRAKVRRGDFQSLAHRVS